jgi:glutathionylspermidine synthase
MSAAARCSTGIPFRAGAPLAPAAFEPIRRRTQLEGCKWDAQVGDVSTLAEFPLLMPRRVWRELAEAAERLSAETFAAEAELLSRSELLGRLGMPRAVRRILASAAPSSPAAARTLRFDFHWTTEGWRLSEVNSDVPGGFAEASLFTQLMADRARALVPAGNPVAAWANAIARAARGAPVALLSAPGFLEDHQILVYLARQLAARSCLARLASPRQLEWNDGVASLADRRLGAVVRFYQGEWLARLPARHWALLFCGGRTPVANPGVAAISESKRFPVVWDALRTPMPTWRALLPETRAPLDAPWRHDGAWLVKSAYSNTGDTVSMRDRLGAREWRRVAWEVSLRPGDWVAQRRFASVPLPTPRGPMHACIGVYTIDGAAAGAYARLAPHPLIDFAAVDCALLVEEAN